MLISSVVLCDKDINSCVSLSIYQSVFNSTCMSFTRMLSFIVIQCLFSASGSYRPVSALANLCQGVLIGSSLNASCTDFEPTVEVKLCCRWRALICPEGASCFFLLTKDTHRSTLNKETFTYTVPDCYIHAGINLRQIEGFWMVSRSCSYKLLNSQMKTVLIQRTSSNKVFVCYHLKHMTTSKFFPWHTWVWAFSWKYSW